jgi:predicted PurR-regulated permease PerM
LLAVLRAVEHGGGLMQSILLTLAVFAVIQIIQDALLTPRIMGKATGLKPVMILLGVFIWGKLLGFLGVVLAIPLTCLGVAYYRRFVLEHDHDLP